MAPAPRNGKRRGPSCARHRRGLIRRLAVLGGSKNCSRDRAVTEQELDDQHALIDMSRAELEAAEARAQQLEAPARTDELRAAEARSRQPSQKS